MSWTIWALFWIWISGFVAGHAWERYRQQKKQTVKLGGHWRIGAEMSRVRRRQPNRQR